MTPPIWTMPDERQAFYRGYLAALQHVNAAQFDTLLVEMIEACDVGELVSVARADGQLGMSGLTRLGYAKRYPPQPEPGRDLQAQLVAVIAAALRDDNRAPADVYPAVVQATGLRRATWAALSPAKRQKIVNRAIAEARKR